MLDGMAPILTAPTSWRKPRAANKTRRSSDLTPEEMARVKVALRVLRVRFGGQAALAKALQANPKTVGAAVTARGRPSAGLALRAARLAGVPLEDLLSGAWPVAGSCPHCGRV